MSIKEMCASLCETVSLLEDAIKQYSICLAPKQETQLTKIHDMLLSDIFEYPEDVIECRIITLMLIGEVVREADVDACLVNILDSECLQLIQLLRDKEASET